MTSEHNLVIFIKFCCILVILSLMHVDYLKKVMQNALTLYACILRIWSLEQESATYVSSIIP